MAAAPHDVLEGIERRRVQLQQSIDKLQKALTHWTTWEAEYEMLKEGIQNAQDPSPSQMRTIARDCSGTLLDDKEIEQLLGKGPQTNRSANQVVDMISRRIDYVQQSSATIEKQLDAAEKQLAGVDVLLEPGVDNEDGLPMMDIEEELDEHGNEVSSSINQTGQAAAEIVEVLRKAGLQKAERDKSNPGTILEDSKTTTLPTPASNTVVTQPQTPQEIAPVVSENIEDSKHHASESPHIHSKKTALERDGYNEDLAAINFNTGTKVIELDENDNMIASYPIIPQGESPEDAELRRQMLQYGLSEVGQVVAELDLDRPTVSYSDDDTDEDDDEYEYPTEDEEDEDEYGRSVKPLVTDEYRKQMLELEQKLGARMLENVGPQADVESLAEHMGDLRTMRVRKDEDFQSLMASAGTENHQATSEAPRKKSVKFADSLDVSEAPQRSSKPDESVQAAPRPTATISDDIVERTQSTAKLSKPVGKPEKVSQFKKGRTALDQAPRVLPTPPFPEAVPVPKGPGGRTLANTITEHASGTAEPRAPDEFDALTLQREVHEEYHKARNKFIQQQGGFKPSEEDEERPIVEERDGKTKKVSRFMAARLKAEGL